VTDRSPLAHPALVWDVAIGQSTVVTHHALANLFYRGLVLHRHPLIGDTLCTSTEVVGLRQNRPKPGRHPTGLAVLRIRTVDQLGRPVMDFWRCAMLPLGDLNHGQSPVHLVHATGATARGGSASAGTDKGEHTE
jgi:acyl dehydratase